MHSFTRMCADSFWVSFTLNSFLFSMRHNVGRRSEGNTILPQETWNSSVSLWVLPLHLVWLLRSQFVWSKKMNDEIVHADICFICRTRSPYIGCITDDKGKFCENFLFIQWWQIIEMWNALSFSPAACHSSAKPPQYFLTFSAFWFNVIKLVICCQRV